MGHMFSKIQVFLGKRTAPNSPVSTSTAGHVVHPYWYRLCLGAFDLCACQFEYRVIFHLCVRQSDSVVSLDRVSPTWKVESLSRGSDPRFENAPRPPHVDRLVDIKPTSKSWDAFFVCGGCRIKINSVLVLRPRPPFRHPPLVGG